MSLFCREGAPQGAFGLQRGLIAPILRGEAGGSRTQDEPIRPFLTISVPCLGLFLHSCSWISLRHLCLFWLSSLRCFFICKTLAKGYIFKSTSRANFMFLCVLILLLKKKKLLKWSLQWSLPFINWGRGKGTRPILEISNLLSIWMFTVSTGRIKGNAPVQIYIHY